ncbi:hypothetical protein K5G30_002378 [Enterococcus faecalis]|nr:hypothetical protein [Enterococcus faecalis]
MSFKTGTNYFLDKVKKYIDKKITDIIDSYDSEIQTVNEKIETVETKLTTKQDKLSESDIFVLTNSYSNFLSSCGFFALVNNQNKITAVVVHTNSGHPTIKSAVEKSDGTIFRTDYFDGDLNLEGASMPMRNPVFKKENNFAYFTIEDEGNYVDWNENLLFNLNVSIGTKNLILYKKLEKVTIS